MKPRGPNGTLEGSLLMVSIVKCYVCSRHIVCASSKYIWLNLLLFDGIRIFSIKMTSFYATDVHYIVCLHWIEDTP